MPLELDDRQRAMLQQMGVAVWLPATAFVPAATHASTRTAATPATAPAHAPLRQATPVTPAAATASVASATEPNGMEFAALDWQALAQRASTCQDCALCASRKQTTLCAATDVGTAHWMVVGDAPDEDEERQGQPFAGQAGVLLDNMLRAVGAVRGAGGRQGAYLSTVVKCRPSAGRVPTAPELAQCARYLQREIALVQPKVILAMGRFAVQTLLAQHPEQAALPLGKQRGTLYQYGSVPVVVTYHPKVLLRANADKAKAWADLCLAREVVLQADTAL